MIEVVGCYTTGRAAIAGIAAHRPDGALMDLELPCMSGVAVIQRVAGRSNQTECLVLTVYDDDARLLPALQAGAKGYILKK